MKKEEAIKIRIVQKGDDEVTIVSGIENYGKAIYAIAIGQEIMEVMQNQFKEEKKDEDKQ